MSGRTGWTILVPVKRLDLAKSRLEVPNGLRAPLALAMALDTIEAVLGTDPVARVVVVTAAREVRTAFDPTARLEWLDDPGTGLEAAIARGQEHLVATGAGPAAVLLGDLPALRPAELEAALDVAGSLPRAVVGDAEGTGTTLLTARSAGDLRPHFGRGSLAAHEAAGHLPIDVPGRGLRQDVDTAADLAEAVRLGVGRATAGVLAELTVRLGVPPGRQSGGHATGE
ncbi:2-phospho-L-lactate guanylyltransferase [Actinotalea sp.]|uniref:2-phospho-L-lactate guanylyltransferase n=1 Tax=Actinotalea sp. TaxID=1872145 RepID=UPI003564602F